MDECGRGERPRRQLFFLFAFFDFFSFFFIRRLREEHRTTTVLYTIGRQPVKDTDCFPFLPFIRRRRLLADDICVSLQRKQNKTSSLLLLRNAKRCPTKKKKRAIQTEREISSLREKSTSATTSIKERTKHDWTFLLHSLPYLSIYYSRLYKGIYKPIHHRADHHRRGLSFSTKLLAPLRLLLKIPYYSFFFFFFVLSYPRPCCWMFHSWSVADSVLPKRPWNVPVEL